MAEETDEERLARACGGRVFRARIGPSLPPTVTVLRATPGGGFEEIGTFPASVDLRTGPPAEGRCPHCGNAEGNADRLRCFICNREM